MHKRLTHDVERGWNVNNGMDGELCSLTYTSVDDAAKCILEPGPGAIFSKQM